MLAAAILASALSAPAPLPRRAAPYRVPCACLMTYRGTQYLATFAPGGLYRAETLDGCRQWAGTWSIEGDVLTIDERPANSEFTSRFRFALTPNRAGEVRGPDIALTPLGGEL